MKMFIAILILSTIYTVPAFANEATFTSNNKYFQQVGDNSIPDTTNKHRLIERVKERGYVRVLVTYDMDYTREGRLNSMAQKSAQRQSISHMHNTFLEDVKNLKVSSVKKMKLSPRIALTVDEEALKYLYKSTLIKRISLDIVSKTFLSESISIIKADNTWEGFGLTGEDKKIAIIDTGVDTGHEMLPGKVIDGACFITNDQNLNISSLCPNEEESEFGSAAGDDCGSTTGCDHGTHVAGIAAGNNGNLKGVAPEADIISIQVFSKFSNNYDCEDIDDDGEGDAPCIGALVSDQISALEWIADNYWSDNSVAAVNMSLGDGMYSSQIDCDTTHTNSARKAAIDDLLGNGIITVAASGNKNYSSSLSAPACISYPV